MSRCAATIAARSPIIPPSATAQERCYAKERVARLNAGPLARERRRRSTALAAVRPEYTPRPLFHPVVPEIFSITRSFYDSPGSSVPIVPNG